MEVLLTSQQPNPHLLLLLQLLLLGQRVGFLQWVGLTHRERLQLALAERLTHTHDVIAVTCHLHVLSLTCTEFGLRLSEVKPHGRTVLCFPLPPPDSCAISASLQISRSPKLCTHGRTNFLRMR